MASASVKTRNRSDEPPTAAAPTAAESLPTAPAPESLPAAVDPRFAADFDEFAGEGFSERPEDSITPRLKILQKGSPQVDDHSPDYVPGAKAGMLLDVATNELYDTIGADSPGLLVVQAYFEKNWIEWIPRDAGGGGFVAAYPIDDPVARPPRSRDVPNPKNADARPIKVMPNGHELQETAHHYLILVHSLRPAVLPLKSTGLQASRYWNEIYRNKRLPNDPARKYQSFATLVRLRTVYRSNDEGSWFQIKVEDLGLLPSGPIPDTAHDWDAVYAVARQLNKDAREHGVRVGPPPPSAYGDDDGGSPSVEPGDDVGPL